jgi:hypothetical protein
VGVSGGWFVGGYGDDLLEPGKDWITTGENPDRYRGGAVVDDA